MSKKTNSNPASEEKAQAASAAEQTEEAAQQTEAEAAKQSEEKKPEEAKQQEASEFEKAQQALAQEHDSYLRLAAEYDNYRKRSQKEKESLYTDIRSETVEKFLPVYDNLERALAQETQDAAFKKGVEMTMNQLVSVMEKLGVVSFGAAGEVFDPQLHARRGRSAWRKRHRRGLPEGLQGRRKGRPLRDGKGCKLKGTQAGDPAVYKFVNTGIHIGGNYYE